MIDAEDIFFGKATKQNPVQFASRFESWAKGFSMTWEDLFVGEIAGRAEED